MDPEQEKERHAEGDNIEYAPFFIINSCVNLPLDQPLSAVSRECSIAIQVEARLKEACE